jgi:hypothetical protein
VVGLTAPLQKSSSAVDPADLPSKGGLSNKTALARGFKLLRLPRKAGTVSQVTISENHACVLTLAAAGPNASVRCRKIRLLPTDFH